MPKNKEVNFLSDIPFCHALITTSFYRSIPVREKEKSESEVTLLGLTLVKIFASNYSHAKTLLMGRCETRVNVYLLLSKGLKFFQSQETVGKRGTQYMLVSLLYS